MDTFQHTGGLSGKAEHDRKMERDVLVEVRQVSVRLGRLNVLESVDMVVHSGEIVTLVGLNGAGKSTLVRVLLGILQPDKGTVQHKRDLKIGYTPQYIGCDPVLPMTVRRFLTLGEAATTSQLEEALAEVGASAILEHQMVDISGGELHRVLLARALLRNPDLLVLDEPLAGVDMVGQSELYQLVARIRDQRGCGILLVSHDLHLVMAETDRVVCLNRHVCCSGPPRAVARDPEFSALFGPHLSDRLAIYSHKHDHRHDALNNPVPIDHSEGCDHG